MRKGIVFLIVAAAAIILLGTGLSLAGWSQTRWSQKRTRRGRAPADDTQEHLDGGPVMRNRGVAISLSQAQEFWRKWDGTSSTATITDYPDQAHDGTSVRREIYAGGKQGSEVVVYTIAGGGHTWPGGPQYLPVFLVGKASNNLNATEAIWGFFKKHTR